MRSISGLIKDFAINMSAENDNKPLEEVKPEVEAKVEEAQEVCLDRWHIASHRRCEMPP
jgi:hypothetical protein